MSQQLSLFSVASGFFDANVSKVFANYISELSTEEVAKKLGVEGSLVCEWVRYGKDRVSSGVDDNNTEKATKMYPGEVIHACGLLKIDQMEFWEAVCHMELSENG